MTGWVAYVFAIVTFLFIPLCYLFAHYNWVKRVIFRNEPVVRNKPNGVIPQKKHHTRRYKTVGKAYWFSRHNNSGS